MRERVWNNLANIKFKAIYTFQCSRLADNIGRCYSLFIAIVTTSSVAAWAIWKKYPLLWACIVGLAQVLLIAKPYIPIINRDKDYLEMSFEFDNLYLRYERLWYAYEKGNLKEDDVEKRFYELRNNEIEIEKSHKQAPCPRLKRLINLSQIEAYADLERNFIKGGTT